MCLEEQQCAAASRELCAASSSASASASASECWPELGMGHLGKGDGHPSPSQPVLEEDSLFLGDIGARSELEGQCQFLPCCQKTWRTTHLVMNQMKVL